MQSIGRKATSITAGAWKPTPTATTNPSVAARL